MKNWKLKWVFFLACIAGAYFLGLLSGASMYETGAESTSTSGIVLAFALGISLTAFAVFFFGNMHLISFHMGLINEQDLKKKLEHQVEW